MAGPLNGFRVLDTTSMISGPLGTMMLADQGADVVKIEKLEGGDHTRAIANRRGDLSAGFLNNNRNKRSVALNLKHQDGVAALLKLAETSDVFVQNFRPGVAERMGIGEAAIRAVKPDIIYVSISGFGDKGPFLAKPVYDPLVQALSGLTTVQAGSDQERPRLVRTILPDKLTGVMAAQAISAALIHRLQTGEGQHVTLSMLGCVVAFLWGSDMGSQTFVGAEIPQQDAASFLDLIYETQTGYISVAVQSDKEWHALTEALEKPDWRDDERFLTPALRHQNIDARLRLTQEVLQTKPAEHWLARLEREGVPCAPVLTRSEMVEHPQMQANAIIWESDHPQAGRLRQAAPPAQFSETPADIRFGAPTLGQHTGEVLRAAGYSEADLKSLSAAGVIDLKDEAP
jgi:crotonobetainyl-CoA:carnitine CoA-transferase CaiB-like acyl-CoA transferase